MNSKLLIGLFLTVVIYGGWARADYECHSYDQKSQLVVENSHAACNRLGFNAHIVVINDTASTEFCGQAEASKGGFISKTIIQLVTIKTQSTGLLTIIKKPKFCGRGRCDHGDGTTVTGNLEFENSQTYFSCHETTQ